MAASFVAWIPLTVASIYWHPLAIATVPLAIAVGCTANWLKNRTFHCGITAPLFLVAGTLILLSSMQLIRADSRIVYAFVAAGTVIAFLLEWRYAAAHTSTK